jgi:hypothetical protein
MDCKTNERRVVHVLWTLESSRLLLNRAYSRATDSSLLPVLLPIENVFSTVEIVVLVMAVPPL